MEVMEKLKENYSEILINYFFRKFARAYSEETTRIPIITDVYDQQLFEVFMMGWEGCKNQAKVFVLESEPAEIIKVENPQICAYCNSPANLLGICDSCYRERTRLAGKAAGDLSKGENK